MQDSVVGKLTSNPKYQELVRKRARFGWACAILMLSVYYAFIMTIAFAPQVLGQPLSANGVMTVGIPVGFGVIIFAFLLTGVYVYRANTVFDRMNEELKREVL